MQCAHSAECVSNKRIDLDFMGCALDLPYIICVYFWPSDDYYCVFYFLVMANGTT